MEFRTNGPIIFLVYCAIWKAVPRIWKDQLVNISRSNNLEDTPILSFLKMSEKDTSRIRRIWHIENGDTIPIGQQKWATELNPHEDEDWKYLYNAAISFRLNANLIYFNFQVLHRSLMTNKKLCQFNLRIDELCET